MKILYVSQYFPPEMGAPAARAAELSKYWARMGHDVTVLTGFPNHPTGVVPENWRARLHRLYYDETVDGVRVVRTWLWPLPNRKWHERMRNYLSFCVSASITGLFLPRADVIIATSPQLLVALAGWWVAWCKGVPFVFEVRDLWPESLAAVGAGAEGTLIHRTLGMLAGFLYRHAARIVVVTPAFQDYLIQHWHVPASKICVVENGVETDNFHYDPTARVMREQLNVVDRFLICYIGTLGNAHGLKTLIAAAELLQTRLQRAMFLLIGEGAEKEEIVKLASARGLINVRFLGEQPRERIPAYVSAADLCLVMLKKNDLFKTVIPTKLLEYMACSRPVVVAVDGQARRIVEEAGAGVFVEPENCQALTTAIVDLAEDPARRKEMGSRGRQYVIDKFSREETAQRYIRILQEFAS
jgi:glycosyltransferase involved in cell wall biosynthesis